MCRRPPAQPAGAVCHRRRPPAFQLAGLLGAVLLLTSTGAIRRAGDGRGVIGPAVVSAAVPPPGLPSLIGGRRSARTTASRAPPRGGAAASTATASTATTFAGLDAATLRSLGVDESDLGELFVDDEADGEFASSPARRRRQRSAVAEVEEEEEMDDDDDEDEYEEYDSDSSAEEDSDGESDESDGGDLEEAGDEEEYDFEEYEDYEDEESDAEEEEEDVDVGEEWWRNPLGKYQDGDEGGGDEYEEVEESEDEEYDDEPAQRQGGQRSSAGKAKSRSRSGKKPRAASARGKRPSKAGRGKLPSFGITSLKGATTLSALTKRRSRAKTKKSSAGSSMTTSWNVPTPLGSVRVQLPAGVPLGPLTTVIGAIGTFVTNASPTVPIILSLAMANFFLGLVRHARPQQPPSEEEEEYVDQHGYQQYNDGYEDEVDENYGWEQQQQRQQEQEQEYDEDVPMEEDGGLDAYQQQQDQYPEEDAAESAARGPNVLARLASSMPKVPSLFGRGDGRTERRIRRNRKRSLQRDDEVRALYERAEAAEAERDTIEHGYELSSRQLQGQQQQLQALGKTNAYLKAQLRDIQRSSESAVLAERKKADEEMARVRESLVDVLERERRLMRAQMMKASDRLRTLMEDEADALSEDDGPEFAK